MDKGFHLAGPVNGCRFQHIPGNGLEPGQEKDHGLADPLPESSKIYTVKSDLRL